MPPPFLARGKKTTKGKKYVSSLKNLKNELANTAKISNAALRSVTVAAILSEALQEIQQDPILVGGSAVEYYTQGGYSTEDIDMIAEGGPELVQVMMELGFEKKGKDFHHPQLKIYVEFPGRNLQPTEKVDILQIGKRTLKIISREDLIVDRLCAFKYWQSAIDGTNALLLLEESGLRQNHLENRAKEEQVKDALELVEALREEIIRKKLTPQEANRLLQSGMRKLKK